MVYLATPVSILFCVVAVIRLVVIDVTSLRFILQFERLFLLTLGITTMLWRFLRSHLILRTILFIRTILAGNHYLLKVGRLQILLKHPLLNSPNRPVWPNLYSFIICNYCFLFLVLFLNLLVRVFFFFLYFNFFFF